MCGPLRSAGRLALGSLCGCSRRRDHWLRWPARSLVPRLKDDGRPSGALGLHRPPACHPPDWRPGLGGEGRWADGGLPGPVEVRASVPGSVLGTVRLWDGVWAEWPFRMAMEQLALVLCGQLVQAPLRACGEPWGRAPLAVCRCVVFVTHEWWWSPGAEPELRIQLPSGEGVLMSGWRPLARLLVPALSGNRWPSFRTVSQNILGPAPPTQTLLAARGGLPTKAPVSQQPCAVSAPSEVGPVCHRCSRMF